MVDVFTPIKRVKHGIRHGAGRLAVSLNRWSRGRLTPNMVTYVGFAMHAPIALLIASNHFLWAAGMLIVFGLFDTLDGELARAQDRSSLRGMLLDASTDRMKEVLLYSGAAYYLVLTDQPIGAVWATAAVGASICVSYVKAKGEAVVASGKKVVSATALNQMFADGLLTFEMRMAILVVGLLFNQLLAAVAVIAILASVTAVQRLILIGRQLQ